MSVTRHLIAFALLCAVCHSYAQPAKREKIYIHFDKSYYLPGETCWFKAYVVNASDLEATKLSGVLYVDWIDPNGKILKHQKLKISEGEADSEFKFDTESPPGALIKEFDLQ